VATLRFDGGEIPCTGDTTVLDALLEAEQPVAFSCKTGMCLTCLLQATEGSVPEKSQKGVKDTLTAQGYFLPCVCIPEEDLELASPNDADLFSRAVVTGKEMLSPNICRIVMEPATPLYYRAGQFLNLRRDDGLMRSYSLASVPHLDRQLEFHIKRLPRGKMSNWICDELATGDSLDIQGPNGPCFYLPDRKQGNMLLIGNGSGLAPLIGIARDALHTGHAGDIHLYHGSRHVTGTYLHGELLELESEFVNFHYAPCLSRDEPPAGYRAGRAEVTAIADFPDLKDWRVYLCGYPPMVKSARQKSYLAGAAMGDIYADPFDLRDLRTEPRKEE
jgi:NAD(P)H-flavin reductase/ferredoxin